MTKQDAAQLFASLINAAVTLLPELEDIEAARRQGQDALNAKYEELVAERRAIAEELRS